MASWRRVALSAVAVGVALGSIYASSAWSQEEDDEAPAIVTSEELEDPESSVGPPAGSPPAERLEWLSQRIERAIGFRSSLRSARIGIAVSDLVSGQIIYARDPDHGFNIASNTKIVTAAAALALLGADFRYRTGVYVDELSPTGAVKTLYVRGRGDPTLGTSDLMALVDDLVLAGVTSVERILIDGSYFDDAVLPPHFDEQPEEQASFRASVAATSVNFNGVALVVRPSGTGSGPADLLVDPPNDYVKVVGTVHTVGSGRTRIRLKTVIQRDTMELHVGGQIHASAAPRRYRRRVEDPVQYFGSTFRTILERRGVSVKRKEIRIGAVPEEAKRLASRSSPALSVVVRGLGKYSNNFVAEALLKTIAAETRADDTRPATWDDGLAAVQRYLVGYIGLPEGSFYYGNGSGLFSASRFSPRQMLQILATSYRDFRYSSDLVASLAIAGVDGTLRQRMIGSAGERQVRAKTGTLATASALAGYVAVDARRPVAFVVFVNDIPRGGHGSRDARSLQDDVAKALVLYLRSAE